MTHPADLALSESLLKHAILPAAILQEDLEVVERVQALGLKMNLARVLRERNRLDDAGREKALAIPFSEKKAALLEDQLRWLRTLPPAEPPVVELALENGLLTREDVAAAEIVRGQVKEWGIDKRPLEILLETGRLLSDAAFALFDVQREPDQALLTASDLAFCRIAASSRLAAPLDLQEAIASQRRLAVKLKWRRPVAELLFARGKISRDGLLAAQTMVRVQFPHEDPSRFEAVTTDDEVEAKIATLLARRRAASPAQLIECLRLREQLREMGFERRLGEMLIMCNLLKVENIDTLLAAGAGARAATDPSPSGVAALEDDPSSDSAVEMTPLDDSASRIAPLVEDLSPVEMVPIDAEPQEQEPLPDDPAESDDESATDAEPPPLPAPRRRGNTGNTRPLRRRTGRG